MTTAVRELPGIERPIVQAPMTAVPRLAAAVPNAGALGMVTLTWSADAGAVVRETAALTARPSGTNFVLTEDHHRRLDQALDAGLRIVSFMWGKRLCGGKRRARRPWPVLTAEVAGIVVQGSFFSCLHRVGMLALTVIT